MFLKHFTSPVCRRAGALCWRSYQLSPIIALFQIAWKPQVITQPSSCSSETNTSQPSLLQTESTASQKEIKAVAGSIPKLGIYRCSIKPIDNTPKPLHWAGKALIQLGSKWAHREERNKNHGCSRCASYKGRWRAQAAFSRIVTFQFIMGCFWTSESSLCH